MSRIFNIHDITRDAFMLRGPLARHGYDWWWHSFTAQDAETGEDRPFFIEFFICNPALAEDEPVLGQLPANRESGKLPSYLMVKAGTWGAEAFAMYWHAEGMKSAYEGSIVYNGRKYTVTPQKSYGYADKNWGRDFTSPWVWLSSNCLKSRLTGKILENSVFDIGGGRPKVFFVPLDRRLLGVFYYEGKEYDFNFSHVWMKVKTEFSFEEREDEVVWHVRQENRHAVMKTEITCRKKDMLLVNYEAPDGSKKHNRLWNGGNGTGIIRLYDKDDGGLVLVDEIEAKHIGCEYGEYC